MKRILTLLAFLFASPAALAANCATVPYVFSDGPGNYIYSAQVNADFASLVTCANALVPALNPTFSGIVTMPDGTTWSNTGVTVLAGGTTFGPLVLTNTYPQAQLQQDVPAGFVAELIINQDSTTGSTAELGLLVGGANRYVEFNAEDGAIPISVWMSGVGMTGGEELLTGAGNISLNSAAAVAIAATTTSAFSTSQGAIQLTPATKVQITTVQNCTSGLVTDAAGGIGCHP